MRFESFVGLGLCLLLTGCGKATVPAGNAVTAVAAKITAAPKPNPLDEERVELAKIPNPLKSHYLAVSTANAWLNPFIVVGTDSLKIIVFMGDPNPSPVGAGGLLRPKNARKDIEQISPEKLGEMLSDLPANAWPYGRVVAVEESKQPERADRAAMRRNMERALGTLSSLGVVVDEWNEPGSGR